MVSVCNSVSGFLAFTSRREGGSICGSTAGFPSWLASVGLASPFCGGAISTGGSGVRAGSGADKGKPFASCALSLSGGNAPPFSTIAAASSKMSPSDVSLTSGRGSGAASTISASGVTDGPVRTAIKLNPVSSDVAERSISIFGTFSSVPDAGGVPPPFVGSRPWVKMGCTLSSGISSPTGAVMGEHPYQLFTEISA